jgi:WD40 repeat protein
MLLAQKDHSLTLYDLQANQPISKITLAHLTNINKVHFLDQNHNLVLSISNDAHLKIWDLRLNHQFNKKSV